MKNVAALTKICCLFFFKQKWRGWEAEREWQPKSERKGFSNINFLELTLIRTVFFRQFNNRCWWQTREKQQQRSHAVRALETNKKREKNDLINENYLFELHESEVYIWMVQYLDVKRKAYMYEPVLLTKSTKPFQCHISRSRIKLNNSYKHHAYRVQCTCTYMPACTHARSQAMLVSYKIYFK